ncbi:MAG: tRNA pseudouridine(38-40) synthase TruA [Deltaproteobacteria bacterium]|nr:tRNA pseudouridine(38-40) synthase TruA [Deltaproteobacteria bacterium]
MKRRIKLIIHYLGKEYCGWQIQPNGLAIQQVLQESLAKILQEKIIIIASGRTDSGVHALGQVAHFDTHNKMPIKLIRRALNSQLPEDIAILEAEEVSQDFHALKSAKQKTYMYLIFNSREPFPLLSPFTWRRFGNLDDDTMMDCLEHIIGEHDFASFCAADSQAKSSIRKIDEAQLHKIPLHEFGNSLIGNLGLSQFISALGPTDSFHPDEDAPSLYVITIKGRGFLKHMIRNIIGTLVDVGLNKINEQDFLDIFAAKDRRKAGITAPGHGLFLVKVEY